MPFNLGRYEIRPSKIPRNIMHGLDHFWYEFTVTHFYGLGLIHGASWTENYKESQFNERHSKKYPEGSYEFLVRRDSDTGLRPRPKGSTNAFGDDEKTFRHVSDGT